MLVLIAPSGMEGIWAEQPHAYNVYYRNEQSGRICRYCISPMSKECAEDYARKFNERHLDIHGKGKQFPNKRGYYPYSQAWVDFH
jgi:hypothetical protein